MATTDMADPYREIVGKISELTGKPEREINSTTKLYQDAGLAGDDYIDFLDWFADRFGVDLTALHMRDVAPLEGEWGGLWPKRYFELAVQHFIELSAVPSWQASGLADRVHRRAMPLLSWLLT